MNHRAVAAVVGFVVVCTFGSGAGAAWPVQNLGMESTPTFYDLNGDGRKEIVAATLGGTEVYALNGSRLMLCPPFGDIFGSDASVGIADLDGDGSPEIVVVDGSHPRVAVFDATCHFKPGWPVTLPGMTGGVNCAPTLVDLDGDGTLEVALETQKGVFVYRYNGTPQPNWPFLWPPGSQFGVRPSFGIAAGDVDGDGSPDLVAPAIDPLAPMLYVLTADGHVAPGWPRSTAQNQSAPALADLDGDGRLEIVTQDYFNFVRVFRFDGSYQPGWPVPYASSGDLSYGTPAIADVDGDGMLEIVVASSPGLLYVFRQDGSYYPGFPLDVGATNLVSSPSVIDIDGDGRREIFLQFNQRTSPSTQFVSGWRLNGTVVPGFPQFLVTGSSNATRSSTDFADAEGQGRYALTVGAEGNLLGLTWYLPITSSTVTPGAEIDAWPRIQHDATNRSCLCTPRLNCDDGNPCTHDAVEPVTHTCTHLPEPPGTACDDGNACTTSDSCSGGGCVGGSVGSCDDNNGCTDDSCNPATGCVHTNNTASCDDGNACTTNDTCGGGVCNPGAPAVCDDGNACNGVETCNAATGCVPGTPVACAAPDQCHRDGICQPDSGDCTYANKPDGTTCDDGNSGTSNDVCTGGVCAGSAVCGIQPKPKSSGYYRKLCKDGQGRPYHGDALTAADALCVGRLTSTFAGTSTVPELCAVLDHDSHGVHHDSNGPQGKECTNADAELISLALNICRNYVCTSQEVDSGCSGHDSQMNHTLTTAGASLAAADSILSDPNRDKTACKDAKCLTKEINTGKGIHQISLAIAKEPGAGNKVRLTWNDPVMDDGTGAGVSYTVWRRGLQADAVFAKLAETPNLTYVDATADTGNFEYEVTFTIGP